MISIHQGVGVVSNAVNADRRLSSGSRDSGQGEENCRAGLCGRKFPRGNFGRKISNFVNSIIIEVQFQKLFAVAQISKILMIRSTISQFHSARKIGTNDRVQPSFKCKNL